MIAAHQRAASASGTSRIDQSIRSQRLEVATAPWRGRSAARSRPSGPVGRPAGDATLGAFAVEAGSGGLLAAVQPRPFRAGRAGDLRPSTSSPCRSTRSLYDSGAAAVPLLGGISRHRGAEADQEQLASHVSRGHAFEVHNGHMLDVSDRTAEGTTPSHSGRCHKSTDSSEPVGSPRSHPSSSITLRVQRLRHLRAVSSAEAA